MGAGGRPLAFKNEKELNDRIEKYKKYLKKEKKPPTIAGLAYYLKVDRQTIYNYKKRDKFFDTIKDFVQWIMMNMEELAITDSSGGIIFLLKNYGYTDKQELDMAIKEIPSIVIKRG